MKKNQKFSDTIIELSFLFYVAMKRATILA